MQGQDFYKKYWCVVAYLLHQGQMGILQGGKRQRIERRAWMKNGKVIAITESVTGNELQAGGLPVKISAKNARKLILARKPKK